jgi:GNAT superfamily N-acetyltransferase
VITRVDHVQVAAPPCGEPAARAFYGELLGLDELPALVEGMADVASAAGCTRLHVITTNDNLPALRLYQRHGFVLAAVRPGAVDLARRRKPEISATGHAGIPIRDELELLRAL